MASDDLPRREKQVVNDFRNAHPYTPPLLNIHDTVPEELVDKALNTLQEAGIKLVEWRSLLYRRMGVPVIIRVCYSYSSDLDDSPCQSSKTL